MIIFIKSILVGVLITAPVGPTAILCINRTLSKGKFSGLISGVGASIADFVFALVTIFSLSTIASFWIKYEFILMLSSSLLLLTIGYFTYTKKTKLVLEEEPKKTYVLDFLSTFTLMITNPLTILLFTSILPPYDLINKGGSLLQGFTTALGIFTGGIIWWLFLVGITGYSKAFIKVQNIDKLNKVIGIILIVLAIVNFGRIL